MADYQTLALLSLLLLAVVVGMVLLVLFELRSSIRSLTPAVFDAATQARQTMRDIDGAVRRLDRLGKVLEDEADMHDFAQSIRETSQSLRKLNQLGRLASAAGTALGPAIAAFIATLAERREPEAVRAGDPRSAAEAANDVSAA